MQQHNYPIHISAGEERKSGNGLNGKPEPAETNQQGWKCDAKGKGNHSGESECSETLISQGNVEADGAPTAAPAAATGQVMLSHTWTDLLPSTPVQHQLS